MRCPTCHRETVREGNPFRPFCSERCRLLDLDNWLNGRYRISTPLGDPQDFDGDPETGESREPHE